SDLSFVVLDGLESLLNKNLLYSAEGRTGETRFFMLETIHEYARERLAQCGEVDDFKTRHAVYFASLAERAEIELHGPGQEYWYARLTDELDNVRTVLDWVFDGANLELGARLVAALREFWYWKGLLSESSAWIDRALQCEWSTSPTVMAKTLNAASRIAYARGNHAEGELVARQALSQARDINDKENRAWAHLFLGSHLMFFDDRLTEAIAHVEESLRLFRELDLKAGTVNGLNMLGELARLDGDYRRAGQLYEECLTVAKEMGDIQIEAKILGNLSYVAFHQGSFGRAIDYCTKASNLISHLQLEYANAIALAMIAGPVGAQGKPELAARLLAASAAQLEAMGATVQPADKLEVDRYRNSVRRQLGEMEFNKAWAEGRAMSFEDAIALALGNDMD
ncbi:MAG: tetratricopeptide repeat protein, partial [Chloroflexota bacterium]